MHPYLHLMALPSGVLADGVYWTEPLNGGPATARQGQRRTGRRVSQGARGKVQKAGREAKTQGANKPVVPSNVIGRYDKTYKGVARSKCITRRNRSK